MPQKNQEVSDSIFSALNQFYPKAETFGDLELRSSSAFLSILLSICDYTTHSLLLLTTFFMGGGGKPSHPLSLLLCMQDINRVGLESLKRGRKRAVGFIMANTALAKL